jgi:hypothetical protein
VSADSTPPKAKDAKDKVAEKLFDPDPNHPWNRLHRFFYVRALAKGGAYAYDGPDAPLGRRGSEPDTFLIAGESHDRAIRLLSDFLKAKDDEHVNDPLERALLQRDLWYVFDGLMEQLYWYPDSAEAVAKGKRPQRRAVQKRLAQLMRRLEQPAARLQGLPDNYALAVKSGAFPTTFDPKRPQQPYLPGDLRLDGKSDWVAIRSRSTAFSAPEHAKFLQGKSVVLSLLRLPGGRKETEDYLAGLPNERVQGFVDLPAGSQVALVRRMLLPDDKGGLQATPVTESVQVRIFPAHAEPSVFEFTLDRGGLLSGRGGLRALTAEDIDYFGFGDFGESGEPLRPRDGRERAPRHLLLNCRSCHGSRDDRCDRLFSINTLFPGGQSSQYEGAARTDLAAQVSLTVRHKTESVSWGLLQGLRETTP